MDSDREDSIASADAPSTTVASESSFDAPKSRRSTSAALTPEERYWKTAFEKKNREFTDLAAVYKDFQRSSTDYEHELENELATAQAELERTIVSLSKTEVQLKQLRREHEEMKGKHGAEMQIVRTQLDAGKAISTSFDETRLRLERDRFDLERKKLERNLEISKQQTEELREQVEAMQNDLEETMKDNERLKSQLLEAQEKSAQRAVEVKRIRRASIDAGNAAAFVNAMASGKEESEDFQRLVSDLKGQLGELKRKLTAMQLEKTQLEERFLEETEVNDQLTEEVSNLTDDFIVKIDLIDKQQAEIDKLYEENETLKRELADVRLPRSDTMDDIAGHIHIVPGSPGSSLLDLPSQAQNQAQDGTGPQSPSHAANQDQADPGSPAHAVAEPVKEDQTAPTASVSSGGKSKPGKGLGLAVGGGSSAVAPPPGVSTKEKEKERGKEKEKEKKAAAPATATSPTTAAATTAAAATASGKRASGAPAEKKGASSKAAIAAGATAVSSEELESFRQKVRELEQKLKEACEKLVLEEEKAGRLLDEKLQLDERMQSQLDLNERLSADVSKLMEKLSEGTLQSKEDLVKQKQQLEQQGQLRAAAEGKLAKLEDDLAEALEHVKEAERLQHEAETKYAQLEEQVKEQAKMGAVNLSSFTRERTELKEHVLHLEARERELVAELDAERKRRQALDLERQAEREAQDKLREEATKRSAAHAQRLAQLAREGKASGNAQHMALSRAATQLSSLHGSLTEMSREFGTASRGLSEDFARLRDGMSRMVGVLHSAQENYSKELVERKKLFDQYQDVKGNIRVFCRVRPLLPHERSAGVQDCLEYPGNNQLAMVHESSGMKSTKDFQFDRVYDPIISQAEIFKDVQNLVLSVLDGYNVCIFAYGQTGSGKTYTMEGPHDARGVNFRAMRSIFDKIKSLSPQWTYVVHVSLLEIYNERLRDLLDSESVAALNQQDDNADDEGKGDGKLSIQRDPITGAIGAAGAIRILVKNPEDVMNAVALGYKNRHVGATSSNEHSSRSHSILVVEMTGLDNVSGTRTHGKLQLIDLAGSERVKESEATGQRLVEATYINKSLSALGDVMTALSTNKKGQHIPYRNSKLTYLLQDSLGGNCKTMMFVNVSPADKHAQETMCSLQFARRVRKVRLSAIASVENAQIQKVKSELDDVLEKKKTLEEKLRFMRQKSEERLKVKEEQIYDLTEQLRTQVAKCNQMELQYKKELGDLEIQLARTQKDSAAATSRNEMQRLHQRHQQLAQKYEQVQNLLKLSQRENQKLKEQMAAVEARHKAEVSGAKVEEHKVGGMLEKTKELQKKELGVKKKQLQQAAEETTDLKKQLMDKDEVIRLLREKNRKMLADVQKFKTEMKKQRVQDVVHGETGRDARGDSVDSVEDENPDTPEGAGQDGDEGGDQEPSLLDESKSRIFQALRHHQQVSTAGAASRLARPRRWKYKETLGKVGTLLNDPKSAPVSRESSLAKHRSYQTGTLRTGTSAAPSSRARNDSQTSSGSNSRSSSKVRFSSEVTKGESGRPLPWT